MIIDFIQLYKKIELIKAPERKGTWHLGQGRDPQERLEFAYERLI